jgi:hypothetical protein
LHFIPHSELLSVSFKFSSSPVFILKFPIAKNATNRKSCRIVLLLLYHIKCFCILAPHPRHRVTDGYHDTGQSDYAIRVIGDISRNIERPTSHVLTLTGADIPGAVDRQPGIIPRVSTYGNLINHSRGKFFRSQLHWCSGKNLHALGKKCRYRQQSRRENDQGNQHFHKRKTILTAV